MYITGGAVRPQQGYEKPYPPRCQATPRPLGPCYSCGGDHLIDDCPNKAPLMQGFCKECGIKHLFVDYPMNLENKLKATFSVVQVTQSLITLEIEVVAPI